MLCLFLLALFMLSRSIVSRSLIWDPGICQFSLSLPSAFLFCYSNIDDGCCPSGLVGKYNVQSSCWNFSIYSNVSKSHIIITFSVSRPISGWYNERSFWCSDAKVLTRFLSGIFVTSLGLLMYSFPVRDWHPGTFCSLVSSVLFCIWDSLRS